MKTITMNVRYKQPSTAEYDRSAVLRGAELSKYLLSHCPDTVGFQEVTPEWYAILQSGMQGYSAVYTPRAEKGEANPVFYRTDKFELIRGETFWLSRTPDVPSKYRWSGCPRIATAAMLRSIETGEVFVHVNTHLDYGLPRIRAKQAEVLVREIAARFGTLHTIVLTGDMNAEGEKCLSHIAQAGFADCATVAVTAKRGATFNNFDLSKPEGTHAIDYVYLKGGKCESYLLLNDKRPCGDYYSDHYGIAVDYIIGGKNE